MVDARRDVGISAGRPLDIGLPASNSELPNIFPRLENNFASKRYGIDPRIQLGPKGHREIPVVILSIICSRLLIERISLTCKPLGIAASSSYL